MYLFLVLELIDKESICDSVANERTGLSDRLTYPSDFTNLPTLTLMNLTQVGYCERRIALWQKYKTDLAIRMLPSEVRGRSGSHSGSMMSSAMTRVMNVAMKPRSRAASQSRSRVESSVAIDPEKDVSTIEKTSRTIEKDASLRSTYNPYNSNKDAVQTARSSHRSSVGGGGADATKAKFGGGMAPILSGA